MNDRRRRVVTDLLLWWSALVIATGLAAFALGALAAMTGFAPGAMLRYAGVWSYLSFAVGAAGYALLLGGAVVKTLRLYPGDG